MQGSEDGTLPLASDSKLRTTLEGGNSFPETVIPAVGLSLRFRPDSSGLACSLIMVRKFANSDVTDADCGPGFVLSSVIWLARRVWCLKEDSPSTTMVSSLQRPDGGVEAPRSYSVGELLQRSWLLRKPLIASSISVNLASNS